ncbi:laminin subunit alpha-like, partial [Paramuricea clavata]
MAALRLVRLVIAIYSIQVFASTECVKLDLESGEIAHGKPISATSTCGEFETYCYSRDEFELDWGVCDGDNSIESVTTPHSSSRYWQSAVLSNSSADERVDITINLKQKYHIYQVSVSTAFTPQPSVWVIEASRNEGKQYNALVYLVSRAQQCANVFGFNDMDIGNNLCIVQERVKNGSSEKVVVSFDGSNVIADHLRLRFIQMWEPKNLQSLEELSRFYTLKEISVRGNQISDSASVRTKRQACYCSEYGTAGFICNVPNRSCPCKREYVGKRCNKCFRGRFNYPICAPCDCSRQGSIPTSNCKRKGGQCRCRPYITGRKCDKCRKGYYGFPSCKWCGCHMKHTTSEGCDIHGKCLCKANYDGTTCGKCKLGYADFPTCRKLACTCPSAGSQRIECNASGQCDCKEGYTGSKCDRCKSGYYGYPDCKECACHYKGSIVPQCDFISGNCICYSYVAGRQCDRCQPGYFGFPRCRQCVCNPHGTPRNARQGNSTCASGNDKFQCRCKTNVGGETCDRCKDLYYNFSPGDPRGCRSCGCFKGATIGALESCDKRSGQCSCKPFMEGKTCYECKRGYHSITSSDIFGCQACKCNPGGALYGNCDKRNGKCQCRTNIAGTRCDRLSRGSVYYPSLHHISVEVEDGKTADRKPVKYGFDVNMFPSYSWKGYVNFLPEQSTVVLSIKIPRRSLYRILFRCIFEPVGYPTTTDVSFTLSPTQGVPGYTRIVSMTLSSTRNQNRERSSLLAVSQNNVVQAFLMFEGVWTVTIDCESKYMLMDYFVFLPEEYYTGRILKTERVDPCVVDGPRDEICDRYSYPEVSDEHAVKHEAEHGYFAREAWGTEDKLVLKYYSNNTVLQQLTGNQLVLMSSEQNRFAVDMNIPKSGFYVFVVHYISHGENLHKIDLYVYREHSSVHVVPCKYQFGCRQVAMKPDVKAVKVFDVDKGQTPLNLFTSREAHIAIDYITAIPYDLWHADYITPALVCRSLQDRCISSNYEEPTKSTQHRPISRSVVNPVGSFSTRSAEKDTLVKFRQFFNKKTDNFVIIIQYQQTRNIVVRGQVSITTYGTTLRGVAEFKYCPNTEFCRIAVKPTDTGDYFRIRQGTTRVEVRFPVKLDVQVSWIYRIPSTSYSDNVLSFTSIDNSRAWVEQCSLNNYVIDPNDPNYCRNTSFALVTNFNNGALSCRCSYLGSRSRYCNSVHGQCTCRRPNIIGRQCLQCRSGYYAFPVCRRCDCDPRGVESGNCDRRGRCKCKPNFSGIKCNRCKPGNYLFPTCKACNCDNHGSLSTFCSSLTGQCQCRRGFDGKRCNGCRVGFFGFPDCKECNCDVSGIKPIAGLLSGCNSTLAVECKCKDNVGGKFCDTCTDFHYNLQFDNPQGCQRCTCSKLGTNSQLKNCDKVSGQCSCKSRVNGHACSSCKDGSTDLRDYSIFGCKGCECNYGGSLDNTCEKGNGDCSCKRNVGGTKCTSVKSDGFYVKNLHHIHAEFEDGTTRDKRPLTMRHNETEFSGFSGHGYVPSLAEQSSFDIIVGIPRPAKYRLLIRYMLDSFRPTYGQITISPTGQVDPLPHGYNDVLVVSLEFKPTSTETRTYAEFLTVKESGKEAEFFLSRGKWRISLFAAPSNLLLDYVVMIPEEYYKATHLRQRVEQPCLVDSVSEYCVDYKYLTVAAPDAVNVPTTLGNLVGARTLLPYAPFKGFSVLNRLSQLYLPLPITKFASYVLMVTYYQEAKTVSDLIVSVTSGFNVQTARIRTFYCKYTFGCRQVAIDDQYKVISFDLFANTRNLLSIGAETTVAV